MVDTEECRHNHNDDESTNWVLLRSASQPGWWFDLERKLKVLRTNSAQWKKVQDKGLGAPCRSVLSGRHWGEPSQSQRKHQLGSITQCFTTRLMIWPIEFLEFLPDLKQAVPNHLADESQTRRQDTPPDHLNRLRGKMVRWCIRLTRLTLACEVIRYRLVQVRQNLEKRLVGLAARNRLSLSLPLSFSYLSYPLSFSKRKSIKFRLVEHTCAHVSRRPSPHVHGESVFDVRLADGGRCERWLDVKYTVFYKAATAK